MSEIIIYKHIKRIMKYGIPKPIAKEIAGDVAAIVGNSSEAAFIESLNYAVNLTYGLGVSMNQENNLEGSDII